MSLRTHFILPSILATLAVLAGCGGSSGTIHTLPGGFTNSSLKGQYVMTQSGVGNSANAPAVPFTEVSIFSADGNGNLNILQDDFNQSGQQITGSGTGTYSLNNDGTGTLVFSFSQSSYAITMIDDSHFYLIEQDPFATSSGYGEMQTTSAFSASPSGTFVFKAHNIDNTSRVGGITITGGAISGTEDILFLGSQSTSLSVNSTVAMSAPSATTGRGTFTITDGISVSSFGYYVVSASKFYFMSNTNSLELGQAQMQTGGPFSVATLANGASYVFGSAGDTNVLGQGAMHSAGVFTTDGNGNITAGAVDFLQDQTVNSDLTIATGSTYTLAANGRGQTNLALAGGNISPQIFWMINSTTAYFLANNTAAVEDGTFSQQSGAPFNALSGQSAFTMDGIDSGGYKDRVGGFAVNGSTFNWNQAANSFNPTTGIGGITLTGTTGTATVSSNGRATVTVNSVSPSFVFYLSSASAGFMLQEDANVGGAFSLQASQ